MDQDYESWSAAFEKCMWYFCFIKTTALKREISTALCLEDSTRLFPDFPEASGDIPCKGILEDIQLYNYIYCSVLWVVSVWLHFFLHCTKYTVLVQCVSFTLILLVDGWQRNVMAYFNVFTYLLWSSLTSVSNRFKFCFHTRTPCDSSLYQIQLKTGYRFHLPDCQCPMCECTSRIPHVHRQYANWHILFVNMVSILLH